MEFVRKAYKPLKAAKLHKKLKLAKKCYKKLIKPAKFVKKFSSFFKRLLLAGAAAPILMKEDNQSFMTFIIKVNPSKAGWQKTIISLLKNCKGAHFKMDQDGVVEVSGISNPNQLLKKIGKSSKIELHWFQFGECSSYLFMPAESKKKKENSPSSNNNNRVGEYGYHNYQHLPQLVFNRPPYYY